MDIAKLILEYIQALAWPAVVVFGVCFFRDAIKEVFHRISSAKLPGGVAIDFSEEIREAREISREVKQQQSVKKAAISEEMPDRPSIPLTHRCERTSDFARASSEPVRLGHGILPTPR